MGPLHAQAHITEKAGGARPPRCPGVLAAPAWKPEAVFAHMPGAAQLRCQPANALVIMKTIGWLRVSPSVKLKVLIENDSPIEADALTCHLPAFYSIIGLLKQLTLGSKEH